MKKLYLRPLNCKIHRIIGKKCQVTPRQTCSFRRNCRRRRLSGQACIPRYRTARNTPGREGRGFTPGSDPVSVRRHPALPVHLVWKNRGVCRQLRCRHRLRVQRSGFIARYRVCCVGLKKNQKHFSQNTANFQLTIVISEIVLREKKIFTKTYFSKI